MFLDWWVLPSIESKNEVRDGCRSQQSGISYSLKLSRESVCKSLDVSSQVRTLWSDSYLGWRWTHCSFVSCWFVNKFEDTRMKQEQNLFIGILKCGFSKSATVLICFYLARQNSLSLSSWYNRFMFVFSLFREYSIFNRAQDIHTEIWSSSQCLFINR